MTVTLVGGPLAGQVHNVPERSPGAVFEIGGERYIVADGPTATYLQRRPEPELGAAGQAMAARAASSSPRKGAK